MPDLRVSFPRPCDETWEAMAPAGCNRVCARCDTLIHDLANYALDEAEALLRANPGSCVRAQVGADGTVALKPGRGGTARRMVIAIAASAGLLTAAAPALAKRDRPGGAIAGHVDSYGFRVQVTATGADGRTWHTRARSNGRYRIRHLPAGTYTITYSSCGESRTVENVVVRDGQVDVPDVRSENQCIVVGQLRIEDDSSSG